MRPIRRRDALLLAGAGAGVSLAGCLASIDDNSGGDGGDHTTDEEIETKVFRAEPTSSRPLWAEDESRTGIVSVLESEQDARTFATRVVRPDENEDVSEDFSSWVQETDFDESVILGVQSVAPDACYDAVEFADLAAATVESPSDGGEVEAITGTAAAVEGVDDDVGCAEVVTYPTAYVRVTGADRPSVAALTIVNGWGEEAQVRSTEPLIDPARLPGGVRPEGNPPAVPAALSCDDKNFERLPSATDGDVTWGEAADDRGATVFAMRVVPPSEDGGHEDGVDSDALTFGRGDEVRISLRNVSTREQTTGNGDKYAVEVKTEDGWQEVRGTDSKTTVGYTDEGVTRPPGEALDWRFELTAEGLIEGDASGQRLRVCPDLRTGRYRFRYWGLPDERSIAVAFDLAA